MSVLDDLLRAPSAAARKKTTATYSPAITSIGVNGVHQADLLELPTDPATGARYALTVIDLGSRAAAARALKTKNAAEVYAALRDIYKNDPHLRRPMRFEVDGGGEFSKARAELRKQGVSVRVARPGRHSQQRAVENLNKEIVRRVMRRQVAEELLTAAPARHWEADLEDYVQDINDRWLREPEENEDPLHFPDLAKPGFTLLEVGTPVRVALDRPRDAATDQPLPTAPTRSGFRTGDLRWEPKVRQIEDINMKPGQSTRYMVSGIDDASYARYQLQPVEVDEDGEPTQKYPPKNVIRGKPETFVPRKLHDRRERAGRVELRVEWRGHPSEEDWSWEPRTSLMRSSEGKRLVDGYQRRT